MGLDITEREAKLVGRDRGERIMLRKYRKPAMIFLWIMIITALVFLALNLFVGTTQSALILPDGQMLLKANSPFIGDAGWTIDGTPVKEASANYPWPYYLCIGILLASFLTIAGFLLKQAYYGEKYARSFIEEHRAEINQEGI